MRIEIIKKNQQKESVWSGGKTNQIYIHPSNSKLQDRDFDFRISSAIVEVEKSDFTPFIGFNRSLMVLEGEVEIIHEGNYSKNLKQYEVDYFSGDWKTTSKGKITEFNLIVKHGLKGELNYLILNTDQIISKEISNLPNRVGYFVISGELKVVVNNSNYSVKKGELVMIEKNDNPSEKLIYFEGRCEVAELLILNV
jgi:environmental stress-induced protein Ves